MLKKVQHAQKAEVKLLNKQAKYINGRTDNAKKYNAYAPNKKNKK